MNGGKGQRYILFFRWMEGESEMNREVFKSILLIILVLASVSMTLNIWFYRTNYEEGPSGSFKQVAIAESKSIRDVIRPTLALKHSGSETFGQTDSTLVTKTYRLFQNAHFTDVFPLYEKNNLPKRSGSVSYEILFPAPLTLDTLQKVFQFNQNDLSFPRKIQVDRVEVYPSTSAGGRLIAIFRSKDGRAEFYAVANNLKIDHLNQTLTSGEPIPYSKQKLSEKSVYLPLENTKIKGWLVYYENMQLESFIPVLFQDPKNVFVNRNKTTFSDGTSQLEKSGNILQFVNPEISSGIAQAPEDPIMRSYQYINSFKGWTDDFIYDGINQAENSQRADVDFRIQLGNYRVYNTEYYPNPYLSMIELTWNNGELSNMNRTLLNFRPIGEQGLITLDSGETMLQKLREAGFSVRTIQDMAIGYRLNHPQEENSHSLRATPDWFFKMNNRWYSATDATLPQHGKEKSGEAQP
ncbi:hypothetical protein EWH99_09500 [Sporolactobacillus sp. THM7-7]|nr:hypothetical protein EWH99_09500 [Sporolactobacillus sp. THM7-7]